MRLVIDYSAQGRNIEVKKITNKVIEIDEHRPKQLELSFEEIPLGSDIETDREKDMWDAMRHAAGGDELPFDEAIPVDDLPLPDAGYTPIMTPPLENKPRIKRNPIKQ